MAHLGWMRKLISEKCELPQMGVALPRLVAASTCTAVLSRWRWSALSNPRFTSYPVVLRGLLFVLDEPRYVHSVQMAQAGVADQRRTHMDEANLRMLQRHFKAAYEARVALDDLANFRRCAALLRALQMWLREPTLSWTRIARRIDVTRRTLSHWMELWTGKHPGELDVEDVPRAANRMADASKWLEQ